MRLGSRRRLRWVLAVFGLVGLSATAGFASAVNRTLETGGVVGYYTSIAIGDDGTSVNTDDANPADAPNTTTPTTATTSLTRPTTKPFRPHHETKTTGSELTAHHTPQHTAITDRPKASSDAAGASAHHQMRPRAPLRLHMGHP